MHLFSSRSLLHSLLHCLLFGVQKAITPPLTARAHRARRRRSRCTSRTAVAAAAATTTTAARPRLPSRPRTRRTRARAPTPARPIMQWYVSVAHDSDLFTLDISDEEKRRERFALFSRSPRLLFDKQCHYLITIFVTVFAFRRALLQEITPAMVAAHNHGISTYLIDETIAPSHYYSQYPNGKRRLQFKANWSHSSCCRVTKGRAAGRRHRTRERVN